MYIYKNPILHKLTSMDQHVTSATMIHTIDHLILEDPTITLV
jgi:hypothetical protein